ncbi:uncharacterized protein J3D65DRAFT_613109 [Phyllosticta citribraziliensis]|uniref:Chorismate synthase protein n=1 Tax=Phyllosticta citribraziliensis TaxID=989973 RepID=A0ABR1M3S0_9PEZI
MISFSGVLRILMWIGPFLFTRGYQTYQSIRSAPPSRIRPLPADVARSLNILYAFALFAFIYSLPYFAPENVFRATSSRLQIPNGPLFVRLSSLHGLSERDELLKAKFVNLESRLLYLAYGPDVLASCPYCTSQEPSSYFYYALPSILAPHLLHLMVLGILTSSLMSGIHGARWRTPAAIAGVSLAAVEIWLLGSYNYQRNATATRLGDIEPFYWRVRTLRYLGFAVVDAALGYIVYLSSTNRWLAMPPTVVERLEDNIRMTEGLRGKLSMLGALKNTVARDRGLRQRSEEYWTNEGQVMGQVLEDREVVDGMQAALERVNVETIERQAGGLADNVVGVMDMMRGMPS